MSDFALSYFNTELDKLDVPSLKQILEKVKTLIAKKEAKQDEIDFSFVDNMVGILSHEEVDEMRKHCHLNFREVEI
ncbi:MAG: hypothetical protein IKO57_07770 [Treponema sp.]|nr:hypothetical protein [Treponema sp.]MCR5126097.1 hypothetical protein [Treponema sp.]